MWGKKKVRNEKGKTIKKYYVKSDEKHHVWIKWKNGFDDDNRIVWSAEPQGKLFSGGEFLIFKSETEFFSKKYEDNFGSF